MHTTSILVLALTLPLAHDLQGDQKTVPALDKDALAKIVASVGRRAVEKEGVPGMTIAVARDGEILVDEGFGWADAARNVSATKDVRWPIGSLTRQFTAVGILQLVDEKKLALDDTLERLLPGFPVGEHRVTLQHLLANTSGIPGWRALHAKHPELARGEMKPEEFFHVFADVPFDFEPGADFSLDSANYVLLSMIVARASGEPYFEYVRTHLIEPLGLAHTYFCPAETRPIGYAEDCREISDDRELEIPMSGVPRAATQSLCSTATDIVAWEHALLDRDAFGARTTRLILTPTRLPDGNSTNYGYALAKGQLGEFACDSHTGGVGGFRVRVASYPEAHVSIVVLANCAGAQVEQFEREIARAVLGLTPQKVADVTLSEEDAARCAGGYQIATTRIRIVSKGGRLEYESPIAGTIALRHQGGLVFVFANDTDARITFHVRDGRAESFEILRGGFVTIGTRMD